jgi:hypothetical protein
MYTIDDYELFIGMDPAIIGDYFGICVHALPNEISDTWLPFLLYLGKLQKGNYTSTWNELTNGILSKYQNFRALNIDYTNEKTLADRLEESYGEDRIKKTPFTKGEAGTKMQMAQTAKTFLDNGYKFPDHNKIENPIIRDNVRTLKQQIITEQILLNPDGSIKFEHKGKHNDLLHAWMLSLDVTNEYMVSKLGGGLSVCGPLYSGRKKSRSNGPDYTRDIDVVRGLSKEPPGRFIHYY